MRLAKMQDEKELVPYQQSAPQAQQMEQQKGMGAQMLDMAKQRAMTSALDAGQEGITKGITSALAPSAGAANAAMLSSTPATMGMAGPSLGAAASGAGAGAGMAALGTAMPYVGMGLMGAKLLGLFEHGGLVGPLSPQYNAEGTKPDFLDLDKDNNKTESMEAAAKDAKEKPQYNAEGGRPMNTPEMEKLLEALAFDELYKERYGNSYYSPNREGVKFKNQGGEIPMPMMRPVPMPMMKPNIMGMQYIQENPQDAAMSLEGYEPILDGSYINASPVMSEIDKMRADYLKSLGE